MKLSREEREAFLAEPHTGSVSVHIDASRGPLTVPLWYHYTPGGEPWILSGEGTRKTVAIEKAGCFTLMVQRMEPTRRYVSVEGSVTRVEPATQAEMDALVYRYLEGDAAERHLEFLRHRGVNMFVSMKPERWIAADKGAF